MRVSWNSPYRSLTYMAVNARVQEKKKDLDFADLVKMTCLLCQRQFKSTNDLGRHVEISQLHQVSIAICSEAE